MRRTRRTKILATLGPASSDKATITRLFRAGADVFRINMSHASHDAHAPAGGDHPRGRGRGRPPDRHPRRPAGAEAAHRHLRRQDRQPDASARPSSSIRQSGARRRDARRTAPSGSPRRARARPPAAARRRPRAPARHQGDQGARGDHRRGRRPPLRPQGRQHPRHHHLLRRADAEGPLRPRSGAQHRRRLDRAVVRPARRKTWPRCASSPAAAPASSPRSRSRRRSSAWRRSSSTPTR